MKMKAKDKAIESIMNLFEIEVSRLSKKDYIAVMNDLIDEFGSRIRCEEQMK